LSYRIRIRLVYLLSWEGSTVAPLGYNFCSRFESMTLCVLKIESPAMRRQRGAGGRKRCETHRICSQAPQGHSGTVVNAVITFMLEAFIRRSPHRDIIVSKPSPEDLGASDNIIICDGIDSRTYYRL